MANYLPLKVMARGVAESRVYDNITWRLWNKVWFRIQSDAPRNIVGYCWTYLQLKSSDV